MRSASHLWASLVGMKCLGTGSAGAVNSNNIHPGQPRGRQLVTPEPWRPDIPHPPQDLSPASFTEVGERGFGFCDRRF